jgi:hypothetical protein
MAKFTSIDLASESSDEKSNSTDLTTELLPVPDEPAVDGVDAIDEDALDEDDDFLPKPKAKLGRMSLILAAVLVAGAGFLGGIWTQKNHGTAAGAATGGFGTRQGITGAQTGEGGFGGRTGTGTGAGGTGTGIGAGTGTGAGGTGTGTGTGAGGTGTGGGTTAAVPAVIGTVTVLTGSEMVVQNLGGKQVSVHLSATTTVSKKFGVADLTVGKTVSVAGTTAADGSVTATLVTVT